MHRDDLPLQKHERDRQVYPRLLYPDSPPVCLSSPDETLSPQLIEQGQSVYKWSPQPSAPSALRAWTVEVEGWLQGLQGIQGIFSNSLLTRAAGEIKKASFLWGLCFFFS